MGQYDLSLRFRGEEKQRYPLSDRTIIIGRANDADIRIEGDTVSRHHLKLYVQGDSVHVEDLGSRNGFKINGSRVRDSNLRAGEAFRLGDFEFQIVERIEQETKPNGVKTATNKVPKPQNGTAHSVSDNRLCQRVDERSASVLQKTLRFQEMANDRGELFSQVVRTAMELIGARRGCLLLQSDPRKSPVVLASQCVENDTSGPGIFSVVFQEVVERRCALMRPYEVPNTDDEEGFGAAISAPIIGASGCVGVLYLDSGNRPGKFNTEALDDLRAYALLCSEAVSTVVDSNGAVTPQVSSG